MSEGFKMRDVVHMGDQVGVPVNYRAMGRRKKNPRLRIELVLSYIRDREGQQITLQELASAAGYGSVSTVHVLMKKLLSEGTVERVEISGGKGMSFAYRVAGSEAPLVDKNGNGPVSSRVDTSILEAKMKEASASEDRRMAVIHEAAVKMRQEEDTRFLARLNMEAWKYLSRVEINSGQNPETRMGREALVLRGFINSLTEGDLDGKRDVRGQEETSGNN